MRFTRLSHGRLGVIVVLILFVSLMTPLAAIAAPAQHAGGNTEWVQIYTVAPGDTLSSIAASFGVSVGELMEANSLHNPNQIYVGQQLIIPENYSEDHGGDYSQGKGGPQCESYYTVRPGDTLSGIAQYYGVDEHALAQVNALYDLNDIYVGQSLCIPAGGGNEYHPQQPQEYPEQYPQQNQQQNSQNNGQQNNSSQTNGSPNNGKGCDPCGPQQTDAPHNDGDHQDSQQCGSCDQHNDGQQNNSQQNNAPQNNGPQNNGSQNNNSQNNNSQNNGSQNNDQGCDTCSPQQNDGPHNDGDQHNGGQQGGDQQGGPQCDSCGQPQNNGPQQNDGPQCDCDNSDHHDEDYHNDGHHLQPTDFWKGTYFNDKYFSEFFQERQDMDVNFNWGTGAPIEGMNKDRFSVRWEKVENFRPGKTRFHATADDGIRVYVDDQLIIDHWVIEPATDYSADVNLSGGPHKLVVEYYEEAEDAVAKVSWENVDNYQHNDQYNDHDEYDHDDHHDDD